MTTKTKTVTPEDRLAAAIDVRSAKQAEVDRLAQRLAEVEADPGLEPLDVVQSLVDELKAANIALAQAKVDADRALIAVESEKVPALEDAIAEGRAAIAEAEAKVKAAQEEAKAVWLEQQRRRSKLDAVRRQIRQAKDRVARFEHDAVQQVLAEAKRVTKGAA